MQETKELKKKNIIGIVIIIVLVAAIVACIYFFILPQSSEEQPDPNFVVFHSYPEGSPQTTFIEKTALPAVKKQHPDLAVTSVYYSESEIYDQMLKAKNEGSLPDVVFLNPESMTGLAQIGVILELGSGTIGETGVDASAGAKAVADNTALAEIIETLSNKNNAVGTISGIRYGIPTEVSVQVLLYNPDLISSTGGVPPSDISSLWNTIDAISTISSPAVGFVLPDAGMKSLAPFVWSNGGELVSEDGEKADRYLNDSKNTGIFDKFAGLFESGGIILADGETDALSMFAEGKAAMTLISTNNLSGFTLMYPEFKFETMPFPSGPAGSVTVLDCNYMCLTVTSDLDASATFLSSVLSSDIIMEADPRFPIPDQALISARPLPMSYSMSDMNNEFLLSMKRITEGYMTTQEALDDLAMKWDAYL